MNNRLISLLGRLHLLERYVDASCNAVEELFDKKIDWELVNAELTKWRVESEQLLLNELT